jgi:hypothetical protein
VAAYLNEARSRASVAHVPKGRLAAFGVVIDASRNEATIRGDANGGSVATSSKITRLSAPLF